MMNRMKGAPVARRGKFRRSVIVVGTALVSVGTAQAFEIGTGNEDVQIRWDNTLRYNLAQRVQEQDAKITGSLNNNDGDRNFKKDSIVSNRLDLLSEFDFIYQKNHGFRISGAAWGDEAYNNLDDHSAAGSNHLVNGAPATGLSSTTKRYNNGPAGELLDAFVFTKVDVGESPLYLKAGRHTVYWGESLFLGGVIHGVAYAQSPLDVAKGLSIPGVEAKELFRPLNNISANFQASNTLSLSAQYFLNWKPFRYPEAGSYLAFADPIMGGGESAYVPLGPGLLVPRLNDITPKKTGDFGVSARWSPEALDGTVGVYYRKFSDKIPQTVIDARGAFVPGQPLGYLLSYGDNIDLFGVSLSKSIGSVSFGAELSYRKNMPLLSDPVVILPGATLPDRGETGAARGNTTHAVVNMLGQIATTPLFDSLDWKVEFTWNRWNKVTEHEELFKGRSGYSGIDRVTKNSTGFGVLLEPKWYSAFPSVDLILPIFYSTGLTGVSAVAQGGAKDQGTFSVGIAADVRNQYRFDLKYIGFFGQVDASNPANVVAKDVPAYLKDRGMLVFNFKTTF